MPISVKVTTKPEWEKYCKHLEEYALLNKDKATEQYGEKWKIINSLPTEEEIKKLFNNIRKKQMGGDNVIIGWIDDDQLAKAIHERISQ